MGRVIRNEKKRIRMHIFLLLADIIPTRGSIFTAHTRLREAPAKFRPLNFAPELFEREEHNYLLAKLNAMATSEELLRT